jgi:type IV secretory pathway VirB2 component (pilin)
MKRRYKALIAVLVPVGIMAILSQVHPISYEYIMGYMIAVVLVFKSSLLSLWLVSKLKIGI